MTAPLLEASNVTKRFAGRIAVDALTFAVHPGEIFALLGPNGAGKTTTVRMIAGIIRPDEGSLTAPPSAQLGYLPEDRGLYRDIPVLRTLVYFGMLGGLARHEATARAEEWLQRVALHDRRHDRLDALSKGNQQRVQLVAAVLRRPALAVLDEPFTGLDPISQEFVLDLVRELRGSGTTILLSAHQMDLVERIADRVLLMNRGRTILHGSRDELRAMAPRLHELFVETVRSDEQKAESAQ